MKLHITVFTVIVLFSCTNATAKTLPDLSDLEAIKNSIANIDFGNITDSANSTNDIALQGASGEAAPIETAVDTGLLAEIKSAAGGITKELSQREPWSITDEYTYSLINDYGNLPKLIDCMDYSLVGSCLSVRWSWTGPKFTFSLAVEHYVRDLHVEVVPQAPTEGIFEVPSNTVLPSSNSVAEDLILVYPYTWKLARTIGSSVLTDGLPSILEDAEGQTVNTDNQQYLYSDVQVSGNIERHFFDDIAGEFLAYFGYCHSPTIPGAVYYNSTLDQFSWRWLATTETVLTAIYQLKYMEWNDVGRSYGSTFPRTGYIESNDRFKTSIISAIRATNIAAENRSQFSGAAGLHIYTPLPSFAKKSFTESKYKTPQDAKSFKLDMIYPFKGERCTDYGANDGVAGSLSVSNQIEDGKLFEQFTSSNPHNAAAFKLYRPFRCCKKRGSKVYSHVSPGSIGTPK